MSSLLRMSARVLRFDGYTLMVGTDAMMTSNVYLYKNNPFDPVKDFAPVTG